MEKRLVKLHSYQLDKLIDHHKNADPITQEIQFCILLALNELKAFRGIGSIEQFADLAKAKEEGRRIVTEMSNVIYNITQRQDVNDAVPIDMLISWCKQYKNSTGANLNIVDRRSRYAPKPVQQAKGEG